MYGFLRVLWVLCTVGGLIISPNVVKEELTQPLLASTSPYSHSLDFPPESSHTLEPKASEGGDVNVEIKELETDHEFGFWTETRPISRKDSFESTNRVSSPVNSLPILERFRSSVNRLISSFQSNQPDQVYYNLAQKITEESQDDELKALGRKILEIKRVLTNHYKFTNPEPSFRIDEATEKFVHYGMTALKKKDLSEKERVLILGTLADLEKCFRPSFSDRFQELEPGVWLSRGELELELTRGKIKSEEVQSLWDDSEKVISDPTVKEALQRVEILDSIHQNLREMKIKKTRLGFGKIHDYFLKTELPDTKNEIEKLGYYVNMVFMDIESSRWEKTHTQKFLSHLYKYNLSKGSLDPLTETLAHCDEVRRGLQRISVQETCQEVFKDTQLTKPAQELLEPFKDLESLKTENVLPAIKAITSDEKSSLELHDQVQIYKVIEELSTVNKIVDDAWYIEVKRNRIFSPRLASIWFELHPTLEPSDFNYKDSEYFDFYLQQFLDAAKRQILLGKLEKENPEMSKKLSNLGRLPHMGLQEEELEKSNDVYDNLISQLELAHSSSDRYQMLIFESLCQLLVYDRGYFEGLIHDIRTRQSISEQINKLCNQVTSKGSWKSGIDPGQLKRITDQIRKIISER